MSEQKQRKEPLLQRKLSEVINILDAVIPKLEQYKDERLQLQLAREKLSMLLEYLKVTYRFRSKYYKRSKQ